MKFWSYLRRACFGSTTSRDIGFPDSLTARSRAASGTDRLNSVIAFYTVDSIYEKEASRMSASARRLGLNVQTTPVPSVGSWVRNASLKAGFLYSERIARRGPLLYVDVDAVFHDNPWPALAEHTGDISVCYNPLSGNLNSATIFINDTPNALVLLEIWKTRCDADPDVWDQVMLETVIAEDRVSATPKFDVRRLPTEFCWIFDLPAPSPKDAVIIEQLQASREVKGKRALFPRKRLRRRRSRVRDIERIIFDSVE